MKVGNRYDFMDGHGVDNRPKPMNFEIRAYDTAQERKKALDWLWENGSNGMKITRKEAERYFGRDFCLLQAGQILNPEAFAPVDPYVHGIVVNEEICMAETKMIERY